MSFHGRSNPNPFIQLLYLSIVLAQSLCGSLALLKSMHSSRDAFSSLQTQQGCNVLSDFEISNRFEASTIP